MLPRGIERSCVLALCMWHVNSVLIMEIGIWPIGNQLVYTTEHFSISIVFWNRWPLKPDCLGGRVAELPQDAHKALVCFFCGATQALCQRRFGWRLCFSCWFLFLLGASLQAGSGNNQLSRGMPCFCETISTLDHKSKHENRRFGGGNLLMFYLLFTPPPPSSQYSNVSFLFPAPHSLLYTHSEVHSVSNW